MSEYDDIINNLAETLKKGSYLCSFKMGTPEWYRFLARLILLNPLEAERAFERIADRLEELENINAQNVKHIQEAMEAPGIGPFSVEFEDEE